MSGFSRRKPATASLHAARGAGSEVLALITSGAALPGHPTSSVAASVSPAIHPRIASSPPLFPAG